MKRANRWPMKNRQSLPREKSGPRRVKVMPPMLWEKVSRTGNAGGWISARRAARFG